MARRMQLRGHAPQVGARQEMTSTQHRKWLDRRIVHAPDSPMVDLLASIERVAQTSASVLVVGESGVGKEGLVRGIHDLGEQAGGPFAAVNCGAIPENLLESELFGHTRGAFTGATRDHAGRIAAAAGGTLFLDEIGDMPLALQVKLLRVLQERVFEPLGSSQTRKADFRLVAATNQDIEAAVREGRFREDLFYRLDVVRLEVPPLRRRRMDVPPLAEHFLGIWREQHRSQVTGFAPAAMARLVAHDWPGNVRQLENLVQSLLVFKAEGEIDEPDVARRLGPRPEPGEAGTDPVVELPPEGLDLRATVERLERELMRQALRRSANNKAAAATMLGLNRTTLVEKLKRNPVDV